MKREGQEEGLCPEERVKLNSSWLKRKSWLWVTFLSIHRFAAATSFVEDLALLYAHQVVFHSPPVPSSLQSSTDRKGGYRGYSPEPQKNLVLSVKLPAFFVQAPYSGTSSAWGGSTRFKDILPVAVLVRAICVGKRGEEKLFQTDVEWKQGWMLWVLHMFLAKAQYMVTINRALWNQSTVFLTVVCCLWSTHSVMYCLEITDESWISITTNGITRTSSSQSPSEAMEIKNSSSVLRITLDCSTVHTICHAEKKKIISTVSQCYKKIRIKYTQKEMLKYLKVLAAHLSYI